MASRSECCGWASWGALAGVEENPALGERWGVAEPSPARTRRARERVRGAAWLHALLARVRGSRAD